MPELVWKPSIYGGRFANDEYGNRWYESPNGEVITIITPDGDSVQGWSVETAWDNLNTAA